MGLPNILSIFRLALAPVFVVVYFSGVAWAHTGAAVVYVVAGVTDALDGAIARRYNMTSLLGRVLDPLGDKVMTFSVLICITVDEVIPLWAVLVFAAKEIAMGLGGLVIHRRNIPIPPSNYLGKTSTVVFFVVCTILVLFRQIPPDVASWMIGGAIGLTLMAFGGYLLTFTRLMRESRA